MKTEDPLTAYASQFGKRDEQFNIYHRTLETRQQFIYLLVQVKIDIAIGLFAVADFKLRNLRQRKGYEAYNVVCRQCKEEETKEKIEKGMGGKETEEIE